MKNHTWNKQTVSTNQDKAWKQKALAKKALYKQTAWDKAANNIK